MSDTLDELAEVIGRPGALALCSVYGGGPLYISRNPPASLVKLIGELQCARLSEEFAGEQLYVPMPPIAEARKAFVRELRALGHSGGEISERANLSRRTVYRLLIE